MRQQGKSRDSLPTTKILFVSQQKSGDIVQAALAGYGYVRKSDGVPELLKGVEAVLGGSFFVSATAAEQDAIGMGRNTQ